MLRDERAARGQPRAGRAGLDDTPELGDDPVGGAWAGFELAPAGSASLAGGIAAVSRIPGSMEVWFTGADGSLRDAYWYDGGDWQRFTLGSAGSGATEGGIAAVSRIPNSMEVWRPGADGTIHDHFWYA